MTHLFLWLFRPGGSFQRADTMTRCRAALKFPLKFHVSSGRAGCACPAESHARTTNSCRPCERSSIAVQNVQLMAPTHRARVGPGSSARPHRVKHRREGFATRSRRHSREPRPSRFPAAGSRIVEFRGISSIVNPLSQSTVSGVMSGGKLVVARLHGIVRRSVLYGDATEPFRAAHAGIAQRHHAQRMTVLGNQRLAVHGVGQKHLGRHRLHRDRCTVCETTLALDLHLVAGVEGHMQGVGVAGAGGGKDVWPPHFGPASER